MPIFVTAFVFLLLLPAIAFADVDVDKANALLKEGKSFEALKIVSPCLDADATDKLSNLEDCLYYGEKIAEIAVYNLDTQYQNIADNNKENELANLFKPYKDLGIEPKWEKPLRDVRIYYDHDFFKRLSTLYPESKYKGEVEYLFIRLDAHYTKWEQWNRKLEKLVRDYPNDSFIVKAKFDLALNYDNLWAFTHPKYDLSFFDEPERFPKNNKKSEEYKQKALKLYKEILNTQDRRSLDKWEIRDVEKRVADIPKGIFNKRIHILSGYH